MADEMSAVEVLVKDVLMHYSSPYYDPAKAKEYYLRTRKLKGKEKNLENQSQRDAWGYASKQISAKEKAAKTAAATGTKSAKAAAEAKQQAKLDKLRADAQASRERIIEGLKARLDEINKETPIPANASPKVRAFLTRQNESRRAAAGQKAKETMAVLGRDLRSAIDSARESYQGVQKGLDTQYQNTRKSLDTKFDTARKTEFENIRTKVNPKSKKK